MDLHLLQRQLESFVEAHYGTDARVRGLAPMASGHAGLTFGFEVVRGENGAGELVDALVLRLPPKGVRRKGNTDVYRQAPLLRALKSAALPVPAVRWAEQSERWFEVPFIMMERMPGTTCLMWEPIPASVGGRDAASAIWRDATSALAAFHRFDWKRELAGWESPRSLAEELFRWDRVLAHSPEAAWLRQGGELRDLLARGLPAPEVSPVGLVHGDFQPGNILYEGQPSGTPRLVGVVDWELSFIGPQLIDLGWMMAFCDPGSWEERMRPHGAPAPAAVLDGYQERMGRRFEAARWFRAFGGYRFGAICCLNIKLHRKGLRADPIWDDFGHSVSTLFERARQVLAQGST